MLFFGLRDVFFGLTREKGVWRPGGGLSLARLEDVFLVKDVLCGEDTWHEKESLYTDALETGDQGGRRPDGGLTLAQSGGAFFRVKECFS